MIIKVKMIKIYAYYVCENNKRLPSWQALVVKIYGWEFNG